MTLETEDQIITSRDPEIEKDALAAAGFVFGMLAMCAAGTAWIGFLAYLGGPPGAFFATATTVLAVSTVGTRLARRLWE